MGMTLHKIATELRALPPGTPMEEEARACLANLLIGIEKKHVRVDPVKRRLQQILTALARSTAWDYRLLLNEHDIAMSIFGMDDHYHRPGPLDNYLDCHGVTVQANEDGALGDFWLSPPRRAGGAEIRDAFQDGDCVGYVGRENRPLWLTPLRGEVADLLEKADDSFCTMVDRATYARRIVALLGLSHIEPTAEVLVMVTNETIGNLLYERPDDRAETGPAGSTAIEARGHRRFRPWPRDTDSSPFGRTFDTDDKARKEAGAAHGAPEIVRPRMAMGEFSRCVYLGPLTAKVTDLPGAYLEDLGIANDTASDLLVRLAGIVGL
jgi:hypothetical protein